MHDAVERRCSLRVSNDGFPVGEVIDGIKSAIRRASISNKDLARDLRVASVYLKLNTIATIGAGGRLDFRVPFIGMALRLGGVVTRENTHSLEMVLLPEDDTTVFEVRETPVDTVLIDAIEIIRSVIAEASGGDDPFLLRDGTVELSFAINQDGSFSLGVDGEFKNQVTHTIRLSVEPIAA
jgi:hypothetical protein